MVSLPFELVELVASAVDEIPADLIDCAPLLYASTARAHRIALGRVSRLWRAAYPLRVVWLEDGDRVDRFLEAPIRTMDSVATLNLGVAIDLDPAPIDRGGYLQRILDRLPGLVTVSGVELDRADGVPLTWPAGVRSITVDRAIVAGLARLPSTITRLQIDHLLNLMPTPFTGHTLLSAVGRSLTHLSIQFRDHPLTDCTALRSMLARALALEEIVFLDALPVEVKGALLRC